MNKLPTIGSEEFNCLLKIFLEENKNVDTDLLFIDLLQNDSRFGDQEIFSARVAKYLSTYPRKKKMVAKATDDLLNFLCANHLLPKEICNKERRKIKKLFLKPVSSK